MVRRPRGDAPGSWHHVINRAIAKRPYFEARSDCRFFLSRLAREVRAGRLEVHAYSLMTTHFHLLVRSPVAELSEAMRRIQSSYARHFNRRRHRDGSLIRARFFSKRVESESYRRAVVRYIDDNAVRAGIVKAPAEHEFASARAFLLGPRPKWLSSDWIEMCAAATSEQNEFNKSAYQATFGPREEENLQSLRKMIELRMASTAELDPLDDLVGKTQVQVRRWMARKARLADGMEIGLPVCGPPAVHQVLKRRLESEGEWLVDTNSRTWRGSQLAQSGLLRDLCCLPLTKIARTCQTSTWKATRRVELHHSLVLNDKRYAAKISEITHQAITTTIA